MLNKKNIRIIAFFILLIVVIGILGWICVLNFVGYFKTLTVVKDIPQDFYSVNDNNFLRNNRLDATETYIGFITAHGFFTKLTILKDNETVYSVYNTDCEFRLWDDKLIYRKNSKLYIVDLTTKEKTKVASNVRSFALYQEDIIYLGTKTKEVYRYNFNTKESTLIISDIFRCILLEDCLYLNENSFKYVVKKSLLDGSQAKIYSSDLAAASANYWYFMTCGDDLVYYDDRILTFLNPKTENTRSVQIVPDYFSVGYQDHAVSNDFIYFSIIKTYNYEHLITLHQEDKNNGLWRIDIETLEKEKVSDVEYTWLAYFGDHLVGTLENELYIIDTETFEATKLIEWK